MQIRLASELLLYSILGICQLSKIARSVVIVFHAKRKIILTSPYR